MLYYPAFRVFVEFVRDAPHLEFTHDHLWYSNCCPWRICQNKVLWCLQVARTHREISKIPLRWQVIEPLWHIFLQKKIFGTKSEKQP